MKEQIKANVAAEAAAGGGGDSTGWTKLWGAYLPWATKDADALAETLRVMRDQAHTQASFSAPGCVRGARYV